MNIKIKEKKVIAPTRYKYDYTVKWSKQAFQSQYVIPVSLNNHNINASITIFIVYPDPALFFFFFPDDFAEDWSFVDSSALTTLSLVFDCTGVLASA